MTLNPQTKTPKGQEGAEDVGLHPDLLQDAVPQELDVNPKLRVSVYPDLLQDIFEMSRATVRGSVYPHLLQGAVPQELDARAP